MNPTIPVSIGEMLYVAFSVTVDELIRLDVYPCHNFVTILESYKTKRDEVLRKQGLSQEEITSLTVAATEALCEWLDGKADAEERVEHHFDKWAEELNDHS